MRTVKNVGRKNIKITNIDMEKIYAACGNRNDNAGGFYDFGVEKGARFTGYVAGGGSAFIKSMRFPKIKN